MAHRGRRQLIARRLLAMQGYAVYGRRLYDPFNPLEEFSAAEIEARFRFRPDTIYLILGAVGDLLEKESGRGLPPLLMLLVALRFYATGSYIMVVGDLFRIHECTAWRALEAVTTALCTIRDTVIVWPDGDRRHQLKNKFYNMYGASMWPSSYLFFSNFR